MNHKSNESRIEPVITGIILILLGLLIYWWQMRLGEMEGNRPHHPGSGELMIIFVPGMIVSGLVILFRGIVWKATAFSVRTIFLCGVYMVLLGGFPWIYTGSGEGGGMLGTLLFITLGIPGVIVTIAGILLGGWRKDYE